jgi:hypothetical protein
MAPSSHIVTFGGRLNAAGDAVRLLIFDRSGDKLTGVAA